MDIEKQTSAIEMNANVKPMALLAAAVNDTFGPDAVVGQRSVSDTSSVLPKMSLMSETITGSAFSTGIEGVKTAANQGSKALLDGAPDLLAKFAGAAVAVGAESYGQAKLSDKLAAGGHDTLARWTEPNMIGALTKSSALIMGGASLEMKAGLFAVAQAAEMETNMTAHERAEATMAGLGLTVAAQALVGKRLAAPMAAANFLVPILATGANALGFSHADSSK